MRRSLLIVHFGFALTGIVTTLLGPVLPLLAAEWRLHDAQAGRLFVVQFVVSVMGAVMASKVLSRWGASRTVPIGMFLISVGLFTLGTAPDVQLGMTGIGIYGLGLGFALPATNFLIIELVPDRQASALNILNFSWTVGAVTAPILIAAMLQPFGLRGFLFLVSVLVALVGTVEAFAFPKQGTVVPAVRNGKLPREVRLPFALMTFLFLFLYVGIENGFSGWVPVFSMRSQQASESSTALVQSSFWGALLLGRLLAPLVLRVIRNQAMILGGLTVATTGIILAIASPSMAVLETGVLLSGLGLGPIFPTMVAVFAEWYGTGGAGSIVLGSCGLGGALVPWLVGVVSDRSQNLRLGLAVTLACLAAAAFLRWRMNAVTDVQPSMI